MARSHGKVEKKECPVPRPKGWSTKVAGNERVAIITRAQKEAIRIAIVLAKELRTDAKIHGRNEKIKAGNRYGHDPCPPRGFK